MRTTLTLDDDVAGLVNDAVHRTHASLKQVVNDALRRALASPQPRRAPYRARPHETELRPGFDVAGFNRLADELEDEEILAAQRRGKA